MVTGIQSYPMDKPCIIVDLDPTTGQIRLVANPNDTAVASMLLTFLNHALPKKLFDQKKSSIIGVHGSLPIP